MKYTSILKYLQELTLFGIKTGIRHTKIIANELDNPQNAFTSVLISGTNGKGSTSAFLENILRRSGYKTGLFTSPHLIDVRERIKINGKPITKMLFQQCVLEVKEAFLNAKRKNLVDEEPTFFEVLTLSSFLAFKKEKVELAIIEVGMGGKNDCTNIVEPILSIITNVSLDHTEFLGKNVKEIAREKAGIFRKNRLALVGKTSPLSLKILKEEAHRVGAKLIKLPKIYNEKGKSFLFFKKEKHLLPKPSLKGEHQKYNSALAYMGSLLLMEEGFLITPKAIITGIKKCKWDGRLQIIKSKPKIIIDGAHNLHGIKAIVKFLTSERLNNGTLLFTTLKNKPTTKMLNLLKPYFKNVVLTNLIMKRAIDDSFFIKLSKTNGFCYEKDPIKAFTFALKITSEKDFLLVTGSLYLVGEILKFIRKKKGSLPLIGL